METPIPNAAKTTASAPVAQAPATSGAPASTAAPSAPATQVAAKPDIHALTRDVLKKHSDPATAAKEIVDEAPPVTDPNAPVEETPPVEQPKPEEVEAPAEQPPAEAPSDDVPPEDDPNLITDKPDDAKLPFHKHPRFQEVMRERNEVRQQLASAKPLIDQATQLNTFRQQRNVSDTTFQAAIELAALMDNDPVKAIEALRPHFEALQMWNGERLPDDLQAQVAAGTLPLDAAKELSLSRMRAQQQQGQQKTFQQQQEQLAQRNVMSSLQTWAESKTTTNPDFKPKASPQAQDGPWEYANQQYALACMTTPPRSPQDAVALAEKAYEQTQAFFKQFRKAPVLEKRLGSAASTRASAAPAKTEVKSARDIAKAILAGQKPDQLTYAK